MSRKRKGFDIEIPEDDIATEERQETDTRRRSPMASAIAENAAAVQARKDISDSIQRENNTLAHRYVEAKRTGKLVETIPLADVRCTMLVRDRIPGEDEELESLVTSIRETGLSNPIRVVEHPGGEHYELIQGSRRLAAYRALAKEDDSGAWDRIPAIIMEGDEDLSGLYRRMVDENVIRKDLSFAEMAHAARAYAADPHTDADELSGAIGALYASAPYSKRSYIRSFALLLDELEGLLSFPTEIPRALGLALAKAIKDRPATAGEVREMLADRTPQSVEEEMDILRRFTGGDVAEPEQQEPDDRKAPARRAGGAKTTFHLKSDAGPVKCTASMGRLEIKIDRDFSAIDRDRLEAAVAALVNGL